MPRIQSAPSETQQTALEQELAGIDVLEFPLHPKTALGARLWHSTWPKLAAIALALAIWQLAAASGWRPSYAFPGPWPVIERLAGDISSGKIPSAAATTLRRGALGFSIAVLVGSALGIAVSSSLFLRRALGSLITGLQTMPSIAWFPLAILLFGLTESAIFFVVLLGAAPAIANGIIIGIDHIPPLLLSAGRVMGARGFAFYRHVVVPAAFPGFVGGLKQGWAFAWRSLMAGELLVIIAQRPSLGESLQFARETSDAEGLMASMIVILVIGLLVDAFLFGKLEKGVRQRWGLKEALD